MRLGAAVPAGDGFPEDVERESERVRALRIKVGASLGVEG